MVPHVVTSVPSFAAFGTCYTCRTNRTDDTPYIDTGIDIVGEGTLLICGLCVRELAELLGMVPSSQFVGLTQKVKRLNKENSALRAKADRFDDLAALLALKSEGNAGLTPVA